MQLVCLDVIGGLDSVTFRGGATVTSWEGPLSCARRWTVCGTLGGGCLEQPLPFYSYSVRWSAFLRFGRGFKVSLQCLETSLAGSPWLITITLGGFLWTAASDTIGLSWSSSWSSGMMHSIAFGRVWCRRPDLLIHHCLLTGQMNLLLE